LEFFGGYNYLSIYALPGERSFFYYLLLGLLCRLFLWMDYADGHRGTCPRLRCAISEMLDIMDRRTFTPLGILFFLYLPSCYLSIIICFPTNGRENKQRGHIIFKKLEFGVYFPFSFNFDILFLRGGCYFCFVFYRAFSGLLPTVRMFFRLLYAGV
jgi:hypothetical protein